MRMPRKRRGAVKKEQSHHKKNKGLGMLVLGLLVLANAYWNVMTWGYFVGIVLILASLAKMIMHMKNI